MCFSLQEGENEDDPPILIEDHHQTSSPRPTTTTTSTTQSSVISSTTSSSDSYQHPNGYPQHYQPQPPFPSVQTSQSKSHYDDKNGGFHRQYIYHDGDNTRQNDGNNNNNNNNDNQATSYQLFSNQGGSSTTSSPQIHQISTVSPLYHATSSTLQSLLTGNNNNNNNNNNPSLIFHNHAIVSTTEQFTVHNNNPRETSDYQRSNENNDNKNSDERRILEPIQSTSQGKISKLTISPIPQSSDKSKQQIKQEHPRQSQTHAISGGFLTIGPSDTGPPTVRSFYPTPKTSKTQSSTASVTHHIHLPPPPIIPQLKPHQVTIHLSPPEIQRIVHHPAPLLPSQSRVIVTAKASVSDESGRPLNTTQLVTLPLPTIPASYDDYKEGDESFDPFYRDVPKIRNSRRSEYSYGLSPGNPRKKRSMRGKREAGVDERETDLDKSVIASTKSDQEDATIASREFTEDDYSTVASGEEYVSQERLDDSKLVEEYDEEYYNDSSKQENLNSQENNERALEDNTYEEYGSQEYPLSDEIDNDKNQTESSTIAIEQETVVTETPITTTESIEVTTVNVMEMEGNKTVEGSVLKFTEEIPGSVEEMEKKEEEEEEVEMKNKEIVRNKQVDIPAASQDYVDDNYEPENYKEQVDAQVVITTDKVYETTTIKSSSIESSTEKVVNVTVSTLPVTTLSETITTTSSTTPSNPPEAASTQDLITTTMYHTSQPEIISTQSTMPSTTITTSTIVSSTNSPSPVTRKRYTTPSTTAYRPTPPKVKSFSTRRAYIYNPPTTTPIPVIIKTKMPLLNPKPAKPPKSYNELAPKPVIRKRPLLAIRTTEEEPITTEISTKINETTEEIIKTTTEQKIAVLSEKLLEKISETIGEEIIEQINDLTTPASISDTTISEELLKDDTTTADKKSEGIINERITSEPPIIHSTTSLQNLEIVTSSTLASVLPVNRKPMGVNRPINGFNCLEKEMYKFYADQRDCRLFHYCSPGFTSRQVLDFRFVCEEGTVFDEETQSCVHAPKNSKCKENTW